MIKIVTDIETVPDQREGAYERTILNIKPPANYKDPEKIEAYVNEKAGQAYLDTALNGLYGQICGIGYKIEDEPAQFIGAARISKKREKQLLEEFWRRMHDATHVGPVMKAPDPIHWIGHNIIDFDLRFLRQRSWVNGVKCPWLPDREGEYCTDLMWKWAGWRKYVKLSELAQAFGLDYPNADGSLVWDWVQAGEWVTLRDYNIAQVEVTAEIYRRMT